MDAMQEFILRNMKFGRKVLAASNTFAVADLEEYDKELKEVEEWFMSGKSGLPPRSSGTIVPLVPMNHQPDDGLKCGRCGIEEIYWKHFPDCRRFNAQPEKP